MIIPTKVLEILETMRVAGDISTIMYDSPNSANVRLDDSPEPIALLYLISDWDIDIEHGVSKEIATVKLFFAKRAEFDVKGEEKDLIVSEMSLLGREFISNLLAEHDLRVVDDVIHMRNVWGKYDSFVCGVEISVKIEQKQGSCLYVEPEPEPEPEPNEDN